jgi:carbamoyl-phosphate synthase large subunit
MGLKIRFRSVTLIEAVLFISIAIGVIIGGLVFFRQAQTASRTMETVRLYQALLTESKVMRRRACRNAHRHRYRIMIIGAGPIVIGQACEFDYSGAQACKALREEGYRVILVNSNPATIMTDPGLADATYIEPITPERGGQDHREGTSRRAAAHHGRADRPQHRAGARCRNGGARRIRGGDDRRQPRGHRDGRGSQAVPRGDGPDRAGKPAPPRSPATWITPGPRWNEVGLPAIIRPAFTLGGTGGGVAYNRDDFEAVCRTGLDASPVRQILIDESLLGWKEFEMEVVRDRADNAIIVCSIENVDPMGVHTGDSITVAPALTLTDKEYQRMRSASDRGVARDRRRDGRVERAMGGRTPRPAAWW